ncbi:MAG TPA: hypothetical protein VFQ53_20340 [Kofleriaceae bacterium]|nr:hypothetical protein [Kofleriaceae bacterium]
MTSETVPGGAGRCAIAIVAGVVAGSGVALVIYQVGRRHGLDLVTAAGESGRFWWLVALMAIIAGTGTYSAVHRALAARARTRHEAARIPTAKARER